MGRDALTYIIVYTNGKRVKKGFSSKWEFAQWLHNEGDHVVDAFRESDDLYPKKGQRWPY